MLDGQCKDYAKMIKSEHQKYVINRFGAYMVPFLYATNGRPYIKQYEQMSGIWCLDVREPFNAPKALSGWSTPEGIEQALEKDIVEADKKLAATGYEVLQDPDGLNLRYYQIEAIQAAEKAIAEHKQTALLAMATGTGKTRTVLGMIYRFLDAGRFKRILYLVDRTSLGDQTMDTFKEVKLKELLTLNQMYDVKSLEDKEFEKDTRVHIATVQSLVKRIMYNESDKSLGVSDYDLVIVDEAHRGYILDKEMGDDEVLYRDQNDFRSKYRAVIDYFDAVKIALTATPALHTTEIFGKPVYSYDYRTAVIDGFLVDHDAPHIIKTKLSEEGISFEKGSTVPIYDPVTNEITNSSELEDDLKFEVEDFNRRVVDKRNTYMSKELQIRNSTVDFLVFTRDAGEDGIEVRVQNGDVWLTQKAISQLFDVDRSVVTKHLSNIFKEGELDENSTCANFAQVADNGKTYNYKFYSLAAIIAVGYRINSERAMQFRTWATKVLDTFTKQGYVLDKSRLINGQIFDEDYFEHLIAEIQEIRASERRFYQKITDIYATAVDYDKNSQVTREFYATVQNKMHYAVHGNTAAELVIKHRHMNRYNDDYLLSMCLIFFS